MRRFEGQVALITGGARGLGYTIARRLGQEGARVALLDRDARAGEDARTRLAREGIEALFLAGDVAEEADVERAVQAVVEQWGRLDVLVNNAGILGTPGNLWETPVEEMDRVYRVNLRGVYLCCQKAVPVMLRQGYGRIVNISSVAGKEGNPRMAHYSATKAGVIALTKSLAKELARTPIRVNCITPGLMRTAMTADLSEEEFRFLAEKIPMGRTVEPEEVASLVAWVASPECSASLGAVFDATGGRSTY